MTKNRDFALVRLSKPQSHFVKISSQIYESLAGAREIVANIVALEEKFQAISENYKAIELYNVQVTLDNLLHGSSFEPEADRPASKLSRLMLSFLSSSRLYCDSALTHAREIIGDEVKKDDIASIFRSAYDSSYSYRVMEAIRNYSQHRAFPIHSTTVKRSWNDEFTENRTECLFYFKLSYVSKDDNFKKQIYSEIEDRGGSVELKSAIRDYFCDICDIHSQIRLKFSESKLQALQIFSDARDSWTVKFASSSLSEVFAVALNEENILSSRSAIWIGPDAFKEMEVLENKSKHITNMRPMRVVI